MLPLSYSGLDLKFRSHTIITFAWKSQPYTSIFPFFLSSKRSEYGRQSLFSEYDVTPLKGALH